MYHFTSSYMVEDVLTTMDKETVDKFEDPDHKLNLHSESLSNIQANCISPSFDPKKSTSISMLKPLQNFLSHEVNVVTEQPDTRDEEEIIIILDSDSEDRFEDSVSSFQELTDDVKNISSSREVNREWIEISDELEADLEHSSENSLTTTGKRCSKGDVIKDSASSLKEARADAFESIPSARETEREPGEISDDSEDDLEQYSENSVTPSGEKSSDSPIIEIYGFSAALKTRDLLKSLSSFKNRGLRLKWVDDTHALGIFPTIALADEALNSDLPLIKTRPLVVASEASKVLAEELVHPLLRPRPQVCTLVAKRLVFRALGVRAVISKEEKEVEQKLIQARVAKNLAAKLRDPV